MLLRSALLLLCARHALSQISHRDRQLAPARWYCDASRGHTNSIFCKTAVLKEAIAMADGDEKAAAVAALKSAIISGNAEAEGLDQTNPERNRMMDAWCESNDPARVDDKKSTFVCAKAKAKSDFFKRREELLTYWCTEQGKVGSPKCKQMDFGKRMQQTESGEERKRMAIEFKSASTVEERDALENETREMMQSVCGTRRAQTPLFESTCSKLQPA